MARASKDTLDKITLVLASLRAQHALTEKSPGIFYLKASAFAHFHEDSDGIFIDIKLDRESYSRHRVSTKAEHSAICKRIVAMFRE
jgi:hypothetical protein